MYVAERPLTLGTCLTQPNRRRTEKQISPLLNAVQTLCHHVGKRRKITKEQSIKLDKPWLLKVCTQTRVVRKEKLSWL